MQIEVNVSEADIGEVKEGQDVEYTLDGYQDSTFYGKVLNHILQLLFQNKLSTKMN